MKADHDTNIEEMQLSIAVGVVRFMPQFRQDRFPPSAAIVQNNVDYGEGGDYSCYVSVTCNRIARQ